MSMGAALKAERALELATRVVAIEMLLRVPGDRPARAADDVAALASRARAACAPTCRRSTDDRPPAPDIERDRRLIAERIARSARASRKSSKEFFNFKLTTRAYVS